MTFIVVNSWSLQLSSTNMNNKSINKESLESNYQIMCLQNVEDNFKFENIESIVSRNYNISNLGLNEIQHIITFEHTTLDIFKDNNKKNFSLYSTIDFNDIVRNQYH